MCVMCVIPIIIKYTNIHIYIYIYLAHAHMRDRGSHKYTHTHTHLRNVFICAGYIYSFGKHACNFQGLRTTHTESPKDSD